MIFDIEKLKRYAKLFLKAFFEKNQNPENKIWYKLEKAIFDAQNGSYCISYGMTKFVSKMVIVAPLLTKTAVELVRTGEYLLFSLDEQKMIYSFFKSSSNNCISLSLIS